MVDTSSAPRARTSPKSKLHQEVGARLRGLRQARGLSQEELAHRIGMSVDAVSNIERGITFTTLETLAKIAATLDIALTEVFAFDQDSRADLPPELIRLIALLSPQPEPVRVYALQQVEALLMLLRDLKP